jgi:hypothetical protein
MILFLHNDNMDAVLTSIQADAEKLYVCNEQPTSFLEASDVYALGVKDNPAFTGPYTEDGKRILRINAVTDGVVLENGFAGFIALTKDSTSKLVAVFALDEVREIDGQTVWTLTGYEIRQGMLA